MTVPTLDLRSDTVTRPSPEMRRAMAEAEVGDDVIDVDPSVQRLQERVAEMLGKEAALFIPSGTMSNQIGLRIHCKPGDELICEANCHIYNYEQGGFAQLIGVATRTVEGNSGVLKLDQLRGLIRAHDDHLVRTRLVCLENTHNRGGGTVLPLDSVREICDWAHEHGLQTHLDGARLFNAVVASRISAAEWSDPFDTVSVCFSKGLGAPVGSALAGSRDAIREARRHRKLLGGGMRQAGILAAGALFALQHNINRLVDDHAHARILADAIGRTPGLTLRPETVETNIVIFQVGTEIGTAPELVAALREVGVWMYAFGSSQIRAVTHLDVSREQVRYAAEVIPRVAERLAATRLRTSQPDAA